MEIAPNHGTTHEYQGIAILATNRLLDKFIILSLEFS